MICCDRHVSLTENSLSRISTEEELFQVYLCESLKYNDIIFEKDYRFEMLKLCYFLLFLEGNSQYLNWLSIFLKERKLTRWDYYPYFWYHIIALQWLMNPVQHVLLNYKTIRIMHSI